MFTCGCLQPKIKMTRNLARDDWFLQSDRFGGLYIDEVVKYGFDDTIKALEDEVSESMQRWIVAASTGKREHIDESVAKWKAKNLSRVCNHIKATFNLAVREALSSGTHSAKRARLEEERSLKATVDLATKGQEELKKKHEEIKILEANLSKTRTELQHMHNFAKDQDRKNSILIAEKEGQIKAFKELAIEAMTKDIIKQVAEVNRIPEALVNKKYNRPVDTMMDQGEDLMPTDDEAYDNMNEGGQQTYAKAASRRGNRPPISRGQPSKRQNNRIPEIETDYIAVVEFPKGTKEPANVSLLSIIKKQLRSNKVIKENNITIRKIRETSSVLKQSNNFTQIRRVFIHCGSDEEVTKLVNILNLDPTRVYQARKFTKANPCIKVIGVDEDRDPKEVAREILFYNNLCPDLSAEASDEEVKARIQFAYMMKNRNIKAKQPHVDLVFEVDPSLHQLIMSKKIIKIDCQVVMVVNKTRFIQCHRCCGFGHPAKRCPFVRENKFNCANCAGDHDTRTCKAEKEETSCINCLHHNKTVLENRKIPVAHTAYSIDCSTRRLAIERAKRSTNLA